jgi:hypothetical protein
MSVEFERAWSDLNLHLREVESSAGFPAALRALEARARERGFLEDALEQVERRRFDHPTDPSRHFRVQYNPKRALRFTVPVNGNASLPKPNGSCVLCRANIQWQQRERQLGYEVKAGEREYFALMNPFPLLPAHMVFASTEHRSQDWLFSDEAGLDVRALVLDLVVLADRMPGYLGFYNGVDAGASNPAHFHYQFVLHPEANAAFPLEIAARDAGGWQDEPGLVDRYPLDVAVWKGAAEDIATRAPEWIARWTDRNRARVDGLSANFIASRDVGSGLLALYFVLRDRTKSRTKQFSGLAGALEVLGEIVLSTSGDKALLDEGQIDYFTLERALASLHTPLEIS